MNEAENRIEQVLAAVIERVTNQDCPPLLASAVRYAVFPGGQRIRPKLCLAVAAANGDSDPELSAAGACAIELLHCASLVHDDLPCFDDARERRGKPSVHLTFGERLAVLTGDALIVTAFESLGLAAAKSRSPERLPALLSVVGQAVGMPMGISAGQAWECESDVDVSLYHRSKTASLFVACTRAGAAVAGAESLPWTILGERIGESYQVADDIRDATSDSETLGKPVGRDEALDRPSAVREFGLDGAVARLKTLVAEGMESIPDCAGRDWLRGVILDEALRFLPKRFTLQAA